MKLYRNTVDGLHQKRWTYAGAIAYFMKGAARELKITPTFFLKIYEKVRINSLKKKYLKRIGNECYYDFNGAKLPDILISGDGGSGWLIAVFDDIFLVQCNFNDNYDKSVVEWIDQSANEGPYGYTDGAFDVIVKKGDIVIDAGAWAGDFSAYAASKGAKVYAFEPVYETHQWLCKTKALNNVDGEGQIYPVQKGLGCSDCELDISLIQNDSGANSICTDFIDSLVSKDVKIQTTEKISITTIDKFVEENRLERVDFIKADIEGAERDMLKGATNVLKTFAPRLAICTYHLPDDPVVLERIIKEANPAYTVVHLRHKLFAAVTNT
jgi:FkbM family methyltransferase